MPESRFEDLCAKEAAHHVPHFTNLALHAERGADIFSHAEDVYVFDQNGKRYLEAMSGLWCAGLGYSQPSLSEAISEQLKILPYAHCFNHRTTDVTVELAQRLSSVAPQPNMRPFFVNSGSEAVDTAIKMAWYVQRARGQKQRHKIIARHSAYHGVSIAGAALTGLPYAHAGFGLPDGHVIHLRAPHYFREAAQGESETAFCDRLVQELEQSIAEQGAENIAAMIAEPVMGAGGVLIPPEHYFPKVQAVLKKHGILMIADEVITGFGRTGRWWGCQRFDIEADLITCAKQLSAAFIPIGAVLISEAIYAELAAASAKHGVFGTGNTYGGHPVACAAALEAINIYQTLDIPAKVRALEAQQAQALAALTEHPMVGHSRSVGLIGAIELIDPNTGRAFDAARKIGPQMAQRCFDQGVVVRSTPNDTIAICPPMIIEPTQLQHVTDTMDRVLQEMASTL